MLAELAAQAAEALVFVGLGMALQAARRPRRPSLPLCTCGHPVILHTPCPQPAVCTQRVRVPRFYEDHYVGTHWIPCPCQSAVPVPAVSAA